MAHEAKPKPADAKAERAARLQAALRENLKRRKAQARARSQARDEHDSAGIRADKED
jgi:hypothetical protein